MAHSVIFDAHVPSENPDAARYKFLKRGRGQGHVTLNFFGALVANSSRTVKATDCQVGTQVKIYFCKNSLVGDMHSWDCLIYTVFHKKHPFRFLLYLSQMLLSDSENWYKYLSVK